MYNEHPDSGLPSQPFVPDSQKNREEHLTSLREIVSLLESFSHIEKMVEEYYSFSRAAIVPHPIVRQLFGSIKTTLENSEPGGNAVKAKRAGVDISSLPVSLLHSASYAINITPTQDIEAFCDCFSGTKLRVETLGLIYTIAARSYLYSPRPVDKGLEDFVQQLVRCSNSSLRLSHELAEQNTNDIIVWLGLENVQLTSLLEGHGSMYKYLIGTFTAVYTFSHCAKV